MKTTQKRFRIVALARLSRRAVFAAAFVSMLALVAVMTGWCDGKFTRRAPAANDARQCCAGNMDMSAIFHAIR
jgi:hypothetical protein